MRKGILFFATAMFLFTAVSCSKNDDDVTSNIYVATVIPDNPLQLVNTVGDTNATKVVLYVQGGPVFDLSTQDLDAFTNDPQFLKAYVHQAQTLNPSLKDVDLTFDQAVAEDETSVDMLHKVIMYYKSLNKEVYVIGHSFGAFLLPKYLDKYGNQADKMAILAGRLEMPDIVWQGFRDGTVYHFPNGVTPEMTTTDAEGGIFRTVAARRLAAGFGMNRYTQLLSDVDLSNVIYSFSTADEPVGSLTAAEESFLTSKQVTVIKIQGGNHGSMFEAPYNTQIFNALTN